MIVFRVKLQIIAKQNEVLQEHTLSQYQNIVVLATGNLTQYRCSQTVSLLNEWHHFFYIATEHTASFFFSRAFLMRALRLVDLPFSVF